MVKYKPMTAWVLSAALGLAMVVFLCATLTKVDIVFMKGDVELGRQENVCAFSKIEAPEDILPAGFLAEGEEIAFTYTDGEEKVDFDHSSFDFKVYIAKTVINNIISFSFDSESNIIVLTAK